MATTYTWGYSNTTASTHDVSTYQLGLKSNYGKKAIPNECTLTNVTSAILNQPEIIRYDFEQQKVSVDGLANPPKSRSGVRYVCTLKEIYRETRDNGEVYDHPFQVSISFKHDTSVNWTNALVAEVLSRAISAMYNETDETWRFESMMRNALEPVTD